MMLPRDIPCSDMNQAHQVLRSRQGRGEEGKVAWGNASGVVGGEVSKITKAVLTSSLEVWGNGYCSGA